VKRFIAIAILAFIPSYAIADAPKSAYDVQQPKDGSIIIFSNGIMSRFIQRYTGSSMNHTAIVLYENGKPYVYEATWPVARRMTWEQYKNFIAHRQGKRRMQRMGLNVRLMQPVTNFTPAELAAMKKFARSQMGRPYRVRNWLENRDSYGTHCSQFVAEVLRASGRYPSPHYWKESPYSVYRKVCKRYRELHF